MPIDMGERRKGRAACRLAYSPSHTTSCLVSPLSLLCSPSFFLLPPSLPTLMSLLIWVGCLQESAGGITTCTSSPSVEYISQSSCVNASSSVQYFKVSVFGSAQQAYTTLISPSDATCSGQGSQYICTAPANNIVRYPANNLVEPPDEYESSYQVYVGEGCLPNIQNNNWADLSTRFSKQVASYLSNASKGDEFSDHDMQALSPEQLLDRNQVDADVNRIRRQVVALLIGLVPCLCESCIIIYFHRKLRSRIDAEKSGYEDLPSNYSNEVNFDHLQWRVSLTAVVQVVVDENKLDGDSDDDKLPDALPPTFFVTGGDD
eukprot:766963-Hanusia_phi.AAC.6